MGFSPQHPASRPPLLLRWPNVGAPALKSRRPRRRRRRPATGWMDRDGGIVDGLSFENDVFFWEDFEDFFWVDDKEENLAF